MNQQTNVLEPKTGIRKKHERLACESLTIVSRNIFDMDAETLIIVSEFLRTVALLSRRSNHENRE